MKPKFDLKQAGCVCGQGVVSNWDAMCGYCRGEVNANHLRTIWQSEDEAEYEKYLAVSESRATHRRKRELDWLGDWLTNFKTYNVGDCLHGDSK